MYMPSLFGESLFDEFFNDFARPARPERKMNPSFAKLMKTDVKETEGSFELDIDLPGYNKADIKAELKDGYLTINASKEQKTEENDNDGHYIRRERFMGSCSRTFYVGDVVTENDIKAKFEDGVLKIEIPKLEKKPELEQKHFVEIAG